jgi:hypothetical protein
MLVYLEVLVVPLMQGWCSPHLFQFLYLCIQNSVRYCFKVFSYSWLVVWYYYCKLVWHTEYTHMVKENEVFHNRYRSLRDVDCKFQARAMSSIVQGLWSQLSISYSRKRTCFQNSERMCGTEIYQNTTVTFMMKCILNHTSWTCKADCIRRQSWFLGHRKEERRWSRSRR